MNVGFDRLVALQRPIFYPHSLSGGKRGGRRISLGFDNANI